MEQRRFDRLVKGFGSGVPTRRAVLGALASLVVAKPAAAQLAPTNCAQVGQMCAFGLQCCSGAACQVSYTNPNFGYCVASTGTTGAGFVFPNAATTTTTTTTTTTGEKGPGGQRHRIHERRVDRRQRKNKRQHRRNDGQSKNKHKNKNNGNPSAFQDGYMLEVTLVCTGSGGDESTTVANTGSQPVTVTETAGQLSGNSLVFSRARLVAPGATVVLKEAGSGSDQDLYSDATDESAVITAWRGDTSSGIPGQELKFRAYCDGRPSKRLQ